jgi:hypothetical protein
MKVLRQSTQTLLLLSLVFLITVILWVSIKNAWISVFAIGMCLGVYVLENMELNEELQSMETQIGELKAQIEIQTQKLIELKKNV